MESTFVAGLGVSWEDRARFLGIKKTGEVEWMGGWVELEDEL